MDQNFNNYLVLGKFNVSRETFSELDEFRDLILKKKQGN